MKLTVIIPVYNGSRTIISCLESLRMQTFQDFKILIIDDGSSDDSKLIIHKYLTTNQNLSATLIQQSNKGVAEARNTGIKLADTDYTTFIDQDDYIAPDYFENYINAIEKSAADIICGGYQRINITTHKIIKTVKLSPNPWSKFIVVAPWAHFYKTDFVQKNTIKFLNTGIGEDVYFTLIAYSYTNKIFTIPDIGYYWVNNPKSHSNSNQKKIQEAINPFIFLNALINDLPKPNKIDKDFLEYFLYRYIIWYILYTVRKTPWNIIKVQYTKLIQWLDHYFPDFNRNQLISLFTPAGEPFSIRLTVWGFNLLYNCHLILPLLRILAIKLK